MKYEDKEIKKKIITKTAHDLSIKYSNKLSIPPNELRREFSDIVNRINGLFFSTKNELIYFCLVLYKYFLDEEENNSITQKSLFKFSFYKKNDRILLDSKNKILSIYLPFIPKMDNGNRYLESRFSKKEKIDINDIVFLLDYFESSIFLNYEQLSPMEQMMRIESLKEDFVHSGEGFADIDIDRMGRLVSELLYYDSSYLRYDIDFERSTEIDIQGKINNEKVFNHPPYHIDTDYRDSPSYKIGFDKQLKKEEFLNLFQFENNTPAMIIKSNYQPKQLVLDVKAHLQQNKEIKNINNI